MQVDTRLGRELAARHAGKGAGVHAQRSLRKPGRKVRHQIVRGVGPGCSTTDVKRLDPLLQRSDAGRAVFLTSGAASGKYAYWGPYAASKAGLEACDEFGFLPQLGRVGSLNVATAASIAMYEWARQQWGPPESLDS